MKIRAEKDFFAGLLYVVLAAAFLWFGREYKMGMASRMGPGYFPLVVSGILIVLGAVIAFQSFREEGEPVGDFAWRGMIFILASPIFFALTVRGLGFVASIFFTSLIASFASYRMTWLRALILAAAVTAFTTVVFVLGLGLPFRLGGPWIGQ